VRQYDQIAEIYDETRGGEQRGDDYAADVDAHLPAGVGPVLEVGVGTGVVALGLARRGRRVVGVDVSSPMLHRAHGRLGAVVVLGDGAALPVVTASMAHAVSVWVFQAVADPPGVFEEVARVLRPGGSYVVCTTQFPTGGDPIGLIIHAMGDAVAARGARTRPRPVRAEQILEWARPAGFRGEVHPLERRWASSPEHELDAIARRAWPTLRELDEEAIEEVTRPAIEALRALPAGECTRRMTADLLVLHL
jgi:ubiquinone/menaquinone biosynthesis C-methylase UbiE